MPSAHCAVNNHHFGRDKEIMASRSDRRAKQNKTKQNKTKLYRQNVMLYKLHLAVSEVNKKS